MLCMVDLLERYLPKYKHKSKAIDSYDYFPCRLIPTVQRIHCDL